MSKGIAYVSLPITGVVATQVEFELDADGNRPSDKELLEKAMEDLYLAIVDTGESNGSLETWSVHAQVVEGNVCHALLNEARLDYIEQQDTGDEE